MHPNDRMTTRMCRVALAVAALLATAAVLPRPASAAPTTAPATQPMAARSDADIGADLKKVSTDLNAALAGGVITDPAKRAVAAPTVVPLIRQEQSLLHEYSAAHNTEQMYATIQQRFDAMRYLLGDQAEVAKVDAAAGLATPADSVPAQSEQLYARWLGTGKDAGAQAAIAGDLEKLDVAHPDSDPLTVLTISFANTAVATDLQSHLRDVATKTMTSPVAARIAASAKEQDASERKLASLAGKPFSLNAATVDGKPFSTDAYKGKVVLVDFWATWCGPCKAGLPEVKEIYGKYHEKGLEIVGVSNDYKADTLKAFTASNNMPWVQLLDAPAAADHKWNPTTLGYGIRGIPTMFLVDKKGVLRSVTARAELQTLIPTLLAE